MSEKPKDSVLRDGAALGKDSDSAVYAATAPISGEPSAERPADRAPRLADGETVAGRYRIARYLARGGMGEVYEAEDLELGERVALKTIREETRDSVAEERFKREIQLSRKVTHPNVCRIFDVGFHASPGAEPIVFLTMELLRGRTLLERIKRDGPLAIGEAAGIVRQICAGLTAAHAASVVHRDLKSANVILTPRAGGGLRAVVTDFGLAHLSGAEESGRTLSGAGEIVGTPGYMAPEQVEGGELSARTDIYSLGVVLYELLTGQLPFDGATPLAIATKRLTTDAPSPKKLRPELPVRWERATLACLQRDPKLRPATPRAVLELLGLNSDSIEELDGTVRIARPPRGIPLVRPALALLTIALVLVGVQRWRTSSLTPAQRVIAALPLSPVGAGALKEPGIGAIAAELIRNQLSTGAGLQSEDTESLAAALRDVGATQAALNDAQLERLRALLAVDLFVVGEYRLSADGTNISVEARLVDAASKRTLVTARKQGALEQLGSLLEGVGAEVGRGAGVSSEALRAGVSLTLPREPVTLRALVEAKNYLLRSEVTAAVAAGQRAIAAEPAYARGHLVLAEAFQLAGNERGAAGEAKRALELAATLPRRERIYVEAFASALARDHGAAVARLSALRAELPHDVELAIKLAEELSAGKRAGDSLALVEQVRKLSISPLQRQRLEFIEASAAETVGDLERALAAARRAVGAATTLELKHARARARYYECHVLDVMNRVDEARAACDDCRRISAEAGARRQRALAVNVIAWIDFTRGDAEGAARAFSELLPIFHDIGDLSSEAMVLNNLASIAQVQGDTSEAKRMFREVLKITDELKDEESSAAALQNLSAMLENEGELAEALVLAERAEQALKDTDVPTTRISAACRTAGLYFEMGRGQKTDAKLAEIDGQLARLTTVTPPDDDCELLRAEVESGRGRPDRAAIIIRGTLDRLVQMKSQIDQYGFRYELAIVLEEAGDLAGARSALVSLDQIKRQGSDQNMERGVSLLRLRLDPPSNRGAALKRLDAMEVSLADDPDRRIALADAIELERTRAALGAGARAVRKLRTLGAQLEKLGLMALALDAERYAFEVEAQLGKRPSAAAATSYATRARVAGRPGWADRVERLRDGR